MNPQQARGRSRRQFYLLVAAFFAPLGLAFLLYYGMDNWRPHGSTNHGELLQPARPLPAFELSTSDGSSVTNADLDGKWNLIYIGDGQCHERCREALVLMRQSRLALSDDLARVQRFFLATGESVAGECCDRNYLDAQHPGLIIVQAGTQAARPLLEVFPHHPAAAPEVAALAADASEPVDTQAIDPDTGYIYIVDPLGNLMMSYSPQAPRKALLEDLKKLLKLSHIG